MCQRQEEWSNVAPAPVVEYTSLVLAATFVVPELAASVEYVAPVPAGISTCASGGAHLTIASCGLRSSAPAVCVAPALVVELCVL